jgi:uncharacterized zinc-type alcohol dehydrogenase-like protein
MKIDCYAILGENQPLEKFQYEARELGDFDVEVAITHCGICYSDIHMIDNDMGMTEYPFVPGHEIVGHITDLGSKVTTHKKGDRVGIGWQAKSCNSCEWCLNGEENLCLDVFQSGTWGNPHGGFAQAIRIDSRFAFPIPENLDSEDVGPLMCGGITVYAPLVNYNVKPSMKVGVIGIGGLGHLALKFARAFGCEVTAFSSSPNKEEEARSFGAHHFVSSNDSDQLQKIARSLDMIICTVHRDLDWNSYLITLRPNGKLCFVGLLTNAISLQAPSIVFGQLSVCGSLIGSRPAIREMLEFAARHDIKALSEVVPMSEVNQAIAKLKENKARYRMVLKN